MYVLRIMI